MCDLDHDYDHIRNHYYDSQKHNQKWHPAHVVIEDYYLVFTYKR